MNFGEKHSIIDRIVFCGVCVLLVFAPLAFGSVHVWAYSILTIGTFFLLAIFFFDRLVLSKKETFEWIRSPVNILLLLVFILIGIQLIPMPITWLDVVSRHTASDKEILLSVMERAGHPVSPYTYTAYYRHPVMMEGIKLAAYVGIFFLVLHTVKSKRRIDLMIYVLIGVGLFEALYAVYQAFSVSPSVWWWKARAGGGRYASGTYVGSNHFAGYMEILVPLTFGFMLAQREKIGRMLSGLGGMRARLQQAVSWLSPESARPKMVFLFFSSVLMGVGLLMSASRSGILCLGISMFIVAVMFFSKRHYRKFGAISLLLCLLALIYGAHIGIDPTLEKFKGTEAGFNKRLYTFQSMFPMLYDYPFMGVGWGNFAFLYPRYVPRDYDGVSTSGYSHNDWLEAGTETGLIGLGMMAAAFFVLLIKLFRMWYTRRDVHAVGIGAGVMAGLLSLGFHSLSDFNMHIPANPFTLAAVLGIGYAAVYRRRQGIQDSFFYKTRQIPLTLWRRVGMGCLAASLIIPCLVGMSRHFIAEIKCPTEWNSTLNLNWNPFLAEIGTAIAKNPFNAEYYWKAAGYYMGARVKGEALRKEYNEHAIINLEQAVLLNPARGSYWFDLGKRYSFRSYDAEEYLVKWLPLAETCFDMAVWCAPLDSNILFDAAWYWVWRSRMLSSQDTPKVTQPENRPLKNVRPNVRSNVRSREAGIQKFQKLFQQSLEINPGRWRQAADRVWEYYPKDDIVLGIIPAANRKMQSDALKYIVQKQ